MRACGERSLSSNKHRQCHRGAIAVNASRTSLVGARLRGREAACGGVQRRAAACGGAPGCRGCRCSVVGACAPACGGGAVQRGATEEEAATQLERGRRESLLPEHLARVRIRVRVRVRVSGRVEAPVEGGLLQPPPATASCNAHSTRTRAVCARDARECAARQASCARHMAGGWCARASVRGPRNDTLVLSAEAHQNRNLGLVVSSSGREGGARAARVRVRVRIWVGVGVRVRAWVAARTSPMSTVIGVSTGWRKSEGG